MKKKLNADAIKSELAGSVFFPTRQEETLPEQFASKPANQQISKKVNQQGSELVNVQTSKEASKQTNLLANQQTNK